MYYDLGLTKTPDRFIRLLVRFLGVSRGSRVHRIHTVDLDRNMTEKFAQDFSPETEDENVLEAEVPAQMNGLRLDQAAAQLFSDFSRVRLQGWIRNGNLQLEGKSARAKDKLVGGELLTLKAEVEDQDHWKAEDIPLDIIFEDDAIIVINKPVGLVVHPAAGNRSGTLLNGLLHRCPTLGKIPRAGIVHRLDKDTSGLMVVAKNLSSHASLVEQLRGKKCQQDLSGCCIWSGHCGWHGRCATGKTPCPSDQARRFPRSGCTRGRNSLPYTG